MKLRAWASGTLFLFRQEELMAEDWNLPDLLEAHLNALRIKSYSEHTIRNRRIHIRLFLKWCYQADIGALPEITVAVLERYQQYLVDYRKQNGQPLASSSRHARLVPLRVWFRWMARRRIIQDNPAAELELPKLGRALPRNVLSAREVERVLRQPCLRRPAGLRDRAILEVLYSTGIRRLELVRLRLADLQLERRLVFVRKGKGDKDRYVPIGERAVRWLRRYLRRLRPQLAAGGETDSVFLTAQGRPISRDHLTWIARKHIANAKLGKAGACHLFRHTMATLMHENGADIRSIQHPGSRGHSDHADLHTCGHQPAPTSACRNTSGRLAGPDACTCRGAWAQ